MTGSSVAMTNANEPQPVETRFGTFTARPRDIVTLADGLPGFESCRRFFLLTSPAIEPLMCLQGLDDARPAFLAIDPRLVDGNYRCALDDLQRRRLGAAADATLLWLSIVRVTESEGSTVNLRAPLVIDPNRMQGVQLLSGHDEYDTAERLE
ncbi:MAG: flagellar assembly protein FliW [Vicinamibacterales bacterium]